MKKSVQHFYKSATESIALLFDHGLLQINAHSPEYVTVIKKRMAAGDLKIYCEVELGMTGKSMLKFFDCETDELIFHYDPKLMNLVH